MRSIGNRWDRWLSGMQLIDELTTFEIRWNRSTSRDRAGCSHWTTMSNVISTRLSLDWSVSRDRSSALIGCWHGFAVLFDYLIWLYFFGGGGLLLELIELQLIRLGFSFGVLSLFDLIRLNRFVIYYCNWMNIFSCFITWFDLIRLFGIIWII